MLTMRLIYVRKFEKQFLNYVHTMNTIHAIHTMHAIDMESKGHKVAILTGEMTNDERDAQLTRYVCICVCI